MRFDWVGGFWIVPSDDDLNIFYDIIRGRNYREGLKFAKENNIQSPCTFNQCYRYAVETKNIKLKAGKFIINI